MATCVSIAHSDLAALGSLSWPQMCACCLAPATAHRALKIDVSRVEVTKFGDRVMGQRSFRVNSIMLEIPYCARCHTHCALRDKVGPDSNPHSYAYGFAVLGGLLGVGLAVVSAGVLRSESWPVAALALASPLVVGAFGHWLAKRGNQRKASTLGSSMTVNCTADGNAVKSPSLSLPASLPSSVAWGIPKVWELPATPLYFSNDAYALVFCRSCEKANLGVGLSPYKVLDRRHPGYFQTSARSPQK